MEMLAEVDMLPLGIPPPPPHNIFLLLAFRDDGKRGFDRSYKNQQCFLIWIIRVQKYKNTFRNTLMPCPAGKFNKTEVWARHGVSLGLILR